MNQQERWESWSENHACPKCSGTNISFGYAMADGDEPPYWWFLCQNCKTEGCKLDNRPRGEGSDHA